MSSIDNFALRGPFQRSTLAGKDVDMSSVERDAGFCSGGDDEELEDLHSPTDVSEDSVEVKVEPISLRNKNKRKCAEPRKVPTDEAALPPYKKRRHFHPDSPNTLTVLPEDRYHTVKQSMQFPNMLKETLIIPRQNVSPFRPWSNPRPSSVNRCTSSSPPSKRTCPSTQVSPPPFQYMERVPELPNQDEPLSLVLKPNKLESEPNSRRALLENNREPEQPKSCEPRIIIKSEFPSVSYLPESNRKLEIPGQEQRRFIMDESSSAVDIRHRELIVGNEVRRLHFGNGTEVKKEPGQFGSHPYTQTRPMAAERSTLQRDTAVDFTTNPGPSRVSDALHSRPQCGDRDRRTLSEMANDDRVICSPEDMSMRVSQSKLNVESLLSGRDIDDRPGPSSTPSTSSDKKNSPSGSNQQRNYKNMTRERRVEANARERTRVHTISAAFDTLRRTIPAYSHNQKLSKLSVLRIACSYILTLSRVAGSDYSADNSEPSLADCVDYVSRTIQTEGKLRKKKDE